MLAAGLVYTSFPTYHCRPEITRKLTVISNSGRVIEISLLTKMEKIFKPQTLQEYLEYMEELSRRGYNVYFKAGKPIVEEIILNE
jgi:hypothetical protein